MQIKSVVYVSLLSVWLAGCSSMNSEVDYKSGAGKARPLEVPPDMTAPETDPRFAVPAQSAAKGTSFSEYSKPASESPCVAPASVPPSAVPAAPAAVAAKLVENNGVKSIQLGEPFDRSWRRVGLALDHAHLAVTDKDRSKGVFFVVAPQPKDSKDKRPDLQVFVRETNGVCDMTVGNQEGKSTEETAQLVDLIYQNLDKSDRGEGRPPRGDAVRRSR